MTTSLYWAIEYIRVFIAYFFIMFVWPLVVFHKVLKGKSKTFTFAFCTTVQIVLINTVVLVLGLFHILKPIVFQIIFFGTFICVIIYRLKLGKKQADILKRLVNGTYGHKLFFLHIRKRIKAFFESVSKGFLRFMKGHWIEYLTLFAVIFFGTIYFTYGVFQDYSYGFGDMYTHSSWIYGLIQGKIFSAGIYPEAMHCLVYAMRVLFGISIYSGMLFLAGIHDIIFFISVYIFLREIFKWKFTPILALMAFFTLDVVCINEIYSMSRLQWTLPQEFGFFTVFLCATFLIRYFKNEKQVSTEKINLLVFIKNKIKSYRRIKLTDSDEVIEESVGTVKLTKGYWDGNLFLFMSALCASLTIHFYPTIMAFFVCLAIVPTVLNKVFNPKRFIPILLSICLGFFVAVLPMAGAFASGIDFQGSIGWAVNIINGTDGESVSTEETVEENIEVENESSAEVEEPDSIAKVSEEVESSEVNDNSTFVSQAHVSLTERIKAAIVTSAIGIKDFFIEKAKVVYHSGYVTLYRKERAQWIVGATCVGLIIGLLGIVFRQWKRTALYITITLCSVCFMMMYSASGLGLPSLIAGARLGSIEQLFIVSMMFVPIDALMQIFTCIPIGLFWNIVGVFATAGIYVGSIYTGYFHGYLYFELTRYNSAVMTTQSIIDSLPEQSYTICSTTDEIYQMIEHGYHEELINFHNESSSDDYTIPTKYIFIYVEKKPIQYAQSHFFTGPSWLALEKYPSFYNSFVSQCPDITTSEISKELAEEAPSSFPYKASVYSNLVNRTYVESSIQEWIDDFSTIYPNEVHVYYEDDDFVCYYIEQNTYKLYQLNIN